MIDLLCTVTLTSRLRQELSLVPINGVDLPSFYSINSSFSKISFYACAMTSHSKFYNEALWAPVTFFVIHLPAYERVTRFYFIYFLLDKFKMQGLIVEQNSFNSTYLIALFKLLFGSFFCMLVFFGTDARYRPRLESNDSVCFPRKSLSKATAAKYVRFILLLGHHEKIYFNYSLVSG